MDRVLYSVTATVYTLRKESNRPFGLHFFIYFSVSSSLMLPDRSIESDKTLDNKRMQQI